MIVERVAVAGSSGLVGRRLVSHLEARGIDVLRLVRRAPAHPGERYWDPSQGELDAAHLEGIDAVINLSGVSIAGKRWSDARKRAIRESRLASTSLLAQTMASLSRPPATFVSTSAVGYYGDGGSNLLTESSPQGVGFLADVCVEWEAAANPARDAGIRVVHPRFGIVLANDGGMLSQLRMLFRAGLGGRIGSGQQYMSWIDIDDLTRVLHLLANDARFEGPVNAVSPNPVDNRAFTEALGNVLNRPTIFPAPEFAVRLAMGQMGEELVLASQRAVPATLTGAGIDFLYPTIAGSLRHQLETSDTRPATQSPVQTVKA